MRPSGRTARSPARRPIAPEARVQESPPRKAPATAVREAAPLSAQSTAPPPIVVPRRPRATGTARVRCSSKDVRQQKRHQRIQSQLGYAAATRLRQTHRLKVRQRKEAVLPERVVGQAVRNLPGVEARWPRLADDTPAN